MPSRSSVCPGVLESDDLTTKFLQSGPVLTTKDNTVLGERYLILT